MKLIMIMTLIIVTMTKCDLKKKLSEHDDHVFGFFSAQFFQHFTAFKSKLDFGDLNAEFSFMPSNMQDEWWRWLGLDILSDFSFSYDFACQWIWKRILSGVPHF